MKLLLSLCRCLHEFFDFISVASVPKRESSRRGAKDKVSQRIKSLATGDDEEDIQDIDLEDSDDDASWTPFKVGLIGISDLRFVR